MRMMASPHLQSVCQLLAHWAHRLTARLGSLLMGCPLALGVCQGSVWFRMTARTSGTAFVLGIGSFVAYKVLCRLLSSNCLWTTLEQRFPRDEEWQNEGEGKAAVELAEGFYAVRLGGENELLWRLDECLAEHDSPTSSSSEGKGKADQQPSQEGALGRLAVVQVRQGSALRQLVGRNRRAQSADIGIGSLGQLDARGLDRDPTRLGPLGRYRRRRDDIVSRYDGSLGPNVSGREEDEESFLSTLSDMTSASRIAPNPRHSEGSPPAALPEQFPEDDTPEPPAEEGSSTSLPVSASFQLQYDNELCWDNEFGDNQEDGLFLFREHSVSPLHSLDGLSQLSAMQNLERMFRSQEIGGGASGREGELEGNEAQQPEEEEEQKGEEDPVDCALEKLRVMERPSLAAHCRAPSPTFSPPAGQPGFSAPLADLPSEAAYRIVPNSDFDQSEVCSSSSLCAAKGPPFCRQPAATQQSQGLWELTSIAFDRRHSQYSSRIVSEKLTRQEPPPQQMVDSVISSHSSLASESALSTKQSRHFGWTPFGQQTAGGGEGGVMFDSAIVADPGSGDEEEAGDQPQKGHRASAGVIRRYGEVESQQKQQQPHSHLPGPPKGNDQPTQADRQRQRRPSNVTDSGQSLEWFGL